MKSKRRELDDTPYQPPLMHAFELAGLKVLPQLNRFEDQHTAQQKSIEPRLMHLLCFLAANQGNVVDRDTLVEQLWPRVVVNDNSLTRAVSELRKHLRGETAGNSAVIETIPKKGYRLIPPSVANTQDTAGVPVNKAGQLRRLPRLVSKPLLGAALAASLAVLVALPPLLSLKPAPTAAFENFSDELVSLTPSYLGGEMTLSASNLRAAEPASTRPIISHDGASYAYLKYDNTGSTLYFGALSENIDPVPIYHHQDQLLNLAWSPTGNSLLFARKPAITTTALFSGKDSELELLTLSLSTREVQRLVKDPLEAGGEAITDQNLT